MTQLIAPALRATVVLLVLAVAGCGGGARADDGPSEPPATPSPSATTPEPYRGEPFTAFITGYTYYDNTPPGSTKISHPRVHKTAGGVGTYRDPVTVAVGHNKKTGTSVLDFPAGTRFYLPYLQKHFIVEDTCGDGPTPETGPCHVNPDGPEPWLDIWLDGKGLGNLAATNCARRITGNNEALAKPAGNLPVDTKPICSSKVDD